MRVFFLLLALACVVSSHDDAEASSEIEVDSDANTSPSSGSSNKIPPRISHERLTRKKGYVIERVYYHNTSCFTQGLLVDPVSGNIVESCGKYGMSYITVYSPDKKKVYSRKSLPRYVFGEGIALIDDQIVALTWREKIGLRYELKGNKLRQVASFGYKTSNTEGWGAALGKVNGVDVIFVSDGSCNIHIWDPKTLKEKDRKCIVDEDGNKVRLLNELEWINGKIFANIWMKNQIAIIDWEEGKVVQWLDMSDLLRWVEIPSDASLRRDAVLNGIALDPSDGGIFITGKLWNRLFKIRLVCSVCLIE